MKNDLWGLATAAAQGVAHADMPRTLAIIGTMNDADARRAKRIYAGLIAERAMPAPQKQPRRPVVRTIQRHDRAAMDRAAAARREIEAKRDDRLLQRD